MFGQEEPLGVSECCGDLEPATDNFVVSGRLLKKTCSANLGLYGRC